MGWFGNIVGWLSGQASEIPPIDHPELGRIQPSHRPKGKPWLWETLDPLHHRRGPVTVTWLAGEEGPSPTQLQFWHWLRDNIDQLVEQARPLLAQDVRDWTEKPMPTDPWQELIWEGAGLPIDGQRTSDWDVSFATRACPDVMLTVYFEAGSPTVVVADD